MAEPFLEAALEAGSRLAQQAIDRRDAAALSRNAALARREEVVVLEAVAFGADALPERTRVASAGVLVAEGDSWFDYPFNDVLKMLEDDFGYDVESVSHKGDTVEEMAYSGGQLEDFTRRIDKVLRTGVSPKAILISGGGNDIAGDEFAMLLNHRTSLTPGFNESVVKGVIEERIRDAYATILLAVTEICESRLGAKVPIVVHGYAFPVPDGRGFLGGKWFLPGPWLEPGFHRKGYAELAECTAMMAALMGRFNEMLSRLCELPPFAHVRFLDLRALSTNGPDYKDFWANELHPTKQGFRTVAGLFADTIG